MSGGIEDITEEPEAVTVSAAKSRVKGVVGAIMDPLPDRKDAPKKAGEVSRNDVFLCLLRGILYQK